MNKKNAEKEVRTIIRNAVTDGLLTPSEGKMWRKNALKKWAAKLAEKGELK